MAARAEIDILAVFGWDKCRQVIHNRLRDRTKTTIDPDTGCFLALGATNSDGYVTVKPAVQAPPGTSVTYKTVYLHRLAYVAANAANCPTGLQISHRCRTANCFNAVHLTPETGPVNRSRSLCAGQIICPHHNNHTVIDLCQHSPKCISRVQPAADYNCCGLALALLMSSSAGPSSDLQASNELVDKILSEDHGPLTEVEEELTSEELELASSSPDLPSEPPHAVEEDDTIVPLDTSAPDSEMPDSEMHESQSQELEESESQSQESGV